jgi:tetratricopeptide (TPR) repeat protein
MDLENSLQNFWIWSVIIMVYGFGNQTPTEFKRNLGKLMNEPLAEKIGVVNQSSVDNQTNIITINGQQVSLIYSDPLPDRRFFQGRTEQQAELRAWMADRQVSLIGLRGEGGIGKSTLMAQVFAHSPDFTGKFWADVRSQTSMTVLAARALQEFGVLPEQVEKMEEKDLIPRLLRLLQQGRYLLAIDNLESVLTPQGAWLSGYEQFWQGFQDIGSESVLLLASREYPSRYTGFLRSRWQLLDQGLTNIEGAALLAALEVEDSQQNRERASEQVQGNPLALSLIAGWLRVSFRPGERFLQSLDGWQQLVGSHRGEKLTVEQVLQWSLDRLTETQRLLLAQLSVLRGAFGLELAQALLPDALVTMEILKDLERRSILPYLSPGEFRFQPRLREFVKERTADLTTAHERAIVYFWEHRLKNWDYDTPLSAFAEYEETFYHQCQLNRYQEAFSTILVWNNFLSLRGHYTTLVDLYGQLHQDWQPTTEERQGYGDVCNNLGIVYDSLGKYQEALNFYQQSLEIKREIGDMNGEAISLNNLGIVYYSLGQYQEALKYYQQSLAIQSEIGVTEGTQSDRSEEANSLMNLGNVYYSLGQYQEAIKYHQQSLEIQREIGDRNREAASLCNLGNVYYSLGKYQEALNFYQQSLEIVCEIGDRKGEASSLMNLGTLYDLLGQYQKALNFLQQSLEIQREIDDRIGEAGSLGNLGIMYYSLGQYQEALKYYQQSLAIQCEIGDRNGEADLLNNLGIMYHSLGKYQEALKFHQQSLEIQREIGDQNGEAKVLWNISNFYLQSGKIRQARQYQVLAVQIWQSLKLPVDATLLPEISKRGYRQLEAQGEDWADAYIQLDEQIGWLIDIIGGIGFLISLPNRLFQKFKTNFFVWFVAGLALTFLIWYLKK